MSKVKGGGRILEVDGQREGGRSGGRGGLENWTIFMDVKCVSSLRRKLKIPPSYLEILRGTSKNSSKCL